MNHYIKNILCITIGSICLLLCLLVFWKHAQFGTCFVNPVETYKVLIIDTKSYQKLKDKTNLVLKNKVQETKLKLDQSWVYNDANEIWTIIVNDSSISSGTYQLFLDYTGLLW